jgi:hypothetical protein
VFLVAQDATGEPLDEKGMDSAAGRSVFAARLDFGIQYLTQ